jgi:poly(3-hydroxybutyrate) depolymerase
MKALIWLIALGAWVPAVHPAPAPKVIPPPGLALTTGERQELAAAASDLAEGLKGISDPRGADIAAVQKALDWAGRFDEVFDRRDLVFARSLRTEAKARLAALAQGRAPWREQSGLSIRGYRSRLDDSIQPYVLLVPPGLDRTKPVPLQLFLNGRGEQRTELNFLAHASRTAPALVMPGTLVLVPYGRFCNANKFGGEVDVFEAMEAVKREFAIDSRRIILAGFSMGGASVWHLATHHPDVWCVATPGAGFAEVPIYTGALQPGKPPRESWEPPLWNWYDAAPYAENLFNCPLLAYSGQIDPQKASADLMEAALARLGMKLERYIGPHTGHKYEPATKAKLIARLGEIAAEGQPAAVNEIHFTTYTLQYPQSGWIRVEGLGRHWARAEVRARRTGAQGLEASTSNVTQVAFSLPALGPVTIDGQPLTGEGGTVFHREGDRWRNGPLPAGLRKRPGLTGPLDDAFMDAFLFVRPTGKPFSPLVGRWVASELEYAQALWRRVFRGEVRIKDDREVTEADMGRFNLILWGDPASNSVLAKVADWLPVQWSGGNLTVGARHFASDHHAAILIYPNPLNAERYIALNSGIDFRMEAYGTNALQTPKLPDWTVVDVSTPPGPRWPGRIAAGGFFDEQWRLP